MSLSLIVVSNVFSYCLVFFGLVLLHVNKASFAHLTIVLTVLLMLSHFLHLLRYFRVLHVLVIVNVAPNRPVVDEYSHLLVSLLCS